MSKKLSTKDAQIYMATYYLQKGKESNPEDWNLIKKYKNHKGLTCRDFYNSVIDCRAILVSDEYATKLDVIENENFDFFLKLVADRPVFYYIPIICNEGLVFVFEPTNNFDNTGQRLKDWKHDKNVLKKKLLTLFKEEEVFSLNEELLFAFPNNDMDEVIRKLECNQMTFNLKLGDCLDQNNYQPIIPDITLASYRFPDDENINQEESIHIIFETVSAKEELLIEDYARIKFLLKKINPDEFVGVKKITLGFKRKKDQKLNSLFDSETNRKKAQELIRTVCANRD